MAGNALTGAMFSVNKGNTGVGTKKTTFEAIDKGIKGVQDWKDNIDEERLKLKTDTAEKYREAEKNVMENLPTDVTVKNQALKYLSNYKDQLYNNAQLVRNGNIKPEDNLIFQENGKQSFQILSDQVKSYDDELTKTIKRAEGGYFLNEKTGKEEFVNPTSGAYEAAMQRVQSQIAGLESVDVEFGTNGMGKVVFYEREFNQSTNTMGVKLDNNGNRIPIKGKQNMSVLSLQQGANQRADRLYMADEVAKLVGEKSVLGGTYKEMMRLGNISGVIVDDFRQNPKLKTVLDDAASNLTATVQRRMSILADNPMFNKDGVSVNTILLPFTEYNQLTTAEKAEMQTYSYTDENGVVIHTGKKRKYVQLVVKNNQLLAEEDDNDRLAATRSAKSSLYAGLQKDISGGSPDRQFDTNSPNRVAGKRALNKQEDDARDIMQAANDFRGATTPEELRNVKERLSNLNPNISGINETTSDLNGEKVVTSFSILYGDGSPSQTVTIGDVKGGKFNAVPVQEYMKTMYGKLSIKGGVGASRAAEIFGTDNMTQKANTKAGDRSYGGKEYKGISSMIVMEGENGINLSDKMAKTTNGGEVQAVASNILDKAVAEFGVPTDLFTIVVDNTGGNDQVTVKDINGKEVFKDENDDTNGSGASAAIDKLIRDYLSKGKDSTPNPGGGVNYTDF